MSKCECARSPMAWDRLYGTEMQPSGVPGFSRRRNRSGPRELETLEDVPQTEKTWRLDDEGEAWMMGRRDHR